MFVGCHILLYIARCLGWPVKKSAPIWFAMGKFRYFRVRSRMALSFWIPKWVAGTKDWSRWVAKLRWIEGLSRKELDERYGIWAHWNSGAQLFSSTETEKISCCRSFGKRKGGNSMGIEKLIPVALAFATMAAATGQLPRLVRKVQIAQPRLLMES